jgi:hypothetical protein
MTMMTDSVSLTLLLVSQSVLLAAAGVALARFQRRMRRLEAFWTSPTAAMLAAESAEDVSHNQASAQIISIDSERALIEKLKLHQRLADVQRRLRDIAERERPPAAPVALEIERSLPIENALRMARNGASVDELTQACGLNVGEARLLQKLHGKATLHAHKG